METTQLPPIEKDTFYLRTPATKTTGLIQRIKHKPTMRDIYFCCAGFINPLDVVAGVRI
jgi:hypothetical protein